MTHGLQQLFGHNAGYVATAILIALTALTVWAVRGGLLRKIGPIEFRPPGEGRPGPSTVTDVAGLSRSDPRLADVVRLYDVDEAKQFYTEIAPDYDMSNSVDLLATHMEVIERINHSLRTKPELEVLDLGCGTGERTATFFLKDRHVHWTAIDFCQAMIGQFQQHLAGLPLRGRPNVHAEDINNVHHLLPARSYDIVLLNLVLSSMPRLPDFQHLAKLVAPGGRLIISDIDPGYTRAHPFYKAGTADGRRVALRTRPVEPLDVATRAKDAGLHLSEMARIGSADTSYSFIAVFASRVRPDEDHGISGSRTRVPWKSRDLDT